MQVVLALDGPAMLDIVGGGSNRVVHRDDDREQPSENCQDLVGHDGGSGVGLPLRKRVCYMVVSLRGAIPSQVYWVDGDGQRHTLFDSVHGAQCTE